MEFSFTISPVMVAAIVAGVVLVLFVLRKLSSSNTIDMTQVGTQSMASPPSFLTRPLQTDEEWVKEHAGMASTLGATQEQVIKFRDLIAGRVGLPGGAIRGDDTLGDLCLASGRDPVAMLKEMVEGSTVELRDAHVAKAAKLKVKVLLMLAVAGEKFASSKEYNFQPPDD